MHTVISNFQDPGRARQSVDRLVEIGVRRGDIHIEHRELQSHSALENFGAFFVSLLGQDLHDEAQGYTRAVEGGLHVLVLDALYALQAERASALLDEMGGRGTRIVHRPLLRPVRDIVSVRAVLADQGRDTAVSTPQAVTGTSQERAMASEGAQRCLDLRDPHAADHAPGLRYSDKSFHASRER